MKRHLALVPLTIILAATFCLAAEEFKLEEGFARWDTGKDLNGWYASSWSGKPVGEPVGWSVVDGAVHLDAKKAKSHLFSKRKFSPNCVIRLEYRAAKGADSGLCLHGKQFQLRDYANSHPDTRRYAPFAKPHGQWNELELDVTDGAVVIKLNGKVIEKRFRLGDDPDRGLGLQKEVGDFDFRRIRVKEK
jgi:hypothetical protein